MLVPDSSPDRQAVLNLVLSTVCRALVRASAPRDLFQTLCDQLAVVPGYDLTRVTSNRGYLASSGRSVVSPPPSFWDEHALTGDRTQVHPDFTQEGDPDLAPWASAILVPFRFDGAATCLAVYSLQTRLFDAEEEAFLRELVVDVERGLQDRLARDRHRDGERFVSDLANLVPGLFYKLSYHVKKGPQFLYVSPGVDLLLPISPNQLIADPGLVFRSLHPGDRRRFFRAGLRSLEFLTVFSLEFRLLRPNGSIVWVLATAFPQKEDDGVVWTGLAIDVTPQNKLQEALQREQETLSVVLNNIGDGVVAVDHEGRVSLVNQTARRLLEWPEDTESPAWAPFVAELPWHASDRFLPWFRTRKDGTTLHLEAHVSDLADARKNRRGQVLLLRDVTDRDRIEERLRQSEKLESIGLLAGGIAHDFNNLLTGVFGFIQLARMNADAPDKVVSYLDHALGPFQRARVLTQQLLTFAKGGEISRVALRLGDLLPATLQLILGDGPIQWRYEIEPPPWPVLVNESQVHQVFENLFLNAKQALPQGGEVSVTVRNVPEPGPEGRGLPNRAYVEVVVDDNGPGMPPEVIAKVFDPFFTTKSGGTGLGLSICFSVLKKHGGTIEAENRPEGGARFRLYFVAQPPLPPPPVEAGG